MAIDRITTLSGRDTDFTGIDFVHVVERCDQKRLHIFFLTDLRNLTVKFTGSNKLLPGSIVIHPAFDPNLPTIQVDEIEEPGGDQAQFDETLQRSFIAITVVAPGDFTRYRLRIDDPRANDDPTVAPFSRIDPFFNDVEFSFKVACAADTDCQPVPAACPPEPVVDFPVDYLARDFVSLRNALLDFAAQRYPQWTMPIEADVGVMLAEVMAALGDELSYVQDRHAREAFLETASQRRSLRKKARLLDFEIHDGRSATTLLELHVVGTCSRMPAQGNRVWAPSEGGAPIPFEIGRGLHDLTDNEPTTYPVFEAWDRDRLVPFFFDDSQRCLQVGATEMFVAVKTSPTATTIGPVPDADLLVNQTPPRWLLLQTNPQAGIPVRTHLVRLTDPDSLKNVADPLQGNQIVTRVRWDARDALPFQIDQTADLRLSFNIVPATAGETVTTDFVTGEAAGPLALFPRAVEREGPQAAPDALCPVPLRPAIHLFGLGETETQGLGFLGEALRSTTPEVILSEVGGDEAKWTFLTSLLGASSNDKVFTLEDGVWRAIRRFRTLGQELVHQDYATGQGFSLRFGDGEFGRLPAASTHFQVSYRTGPGARANVASDAITAMSLPGVVLPDAAKLPPCVQSVTNPLPVTTGVDPETAREIKLNTPEAYQADRFFAVRPEDYAEQTEKLPFVQRAQGTPRWTGSWMSTFVAADPLGSSLLTDPQRADIEAWMDCVRQAGRQVIVRDPNTLGIDLEVTLCIERFAFAAQVVAQVTEVLLGSGLGRNPKGFFHPDNFTFGTPLRRSALEAAIAAVPGVRSVREIRFRLRGARGFQRFDSLTLLVAPDQVLRLDNDPLQPDNGTLRIATEGGA
jgi:hypothetical protein